MKQFAQSQNTLLYSSHQNLILILLLACLFLLGNNSWGQDRPTYALAEVKKAVHSESKLSVPKTSTKKRNISKAKSNMTHTKRGSKSMLIPLIRNYGTTSSKSKKSSPQKSKAVHSIQKK